MNKLSSWFGGHSDQTKVLTLIALGANVLLVFSSSNQTLLADSHPVLFLADFLGTCIGLFIPILIVSAVVAFIGFKVFGGVAEKYRRHLDYLAPVLLLITIFVSYASYRTHLQV